MHDNSLVPVFGPLKRIRVLGLGSLIAMPFAANLMAEFGAEFIQIERPGTGDVYRSFPPVFQRNGSRISSAWMQEARNRLSFTLELRKHDADSRDVFLDLIRHSDILIENMVWLEKFGIRDSDLLAENPKLIIVHISGYGHAEFGGEPEICSRASYDIVGQAFSGYAHLNGYEDGMPLTVKPTLNDYVTALFAVFGMLSATLEVERGGKGQIIDVAQYEAQAKLMRDAFMMNSLGVSQMHRTGNRSFGIQPWNMYLCRDNRYVVLGAVGLPVYRRFLHAVGFSEEEYPYDLVARDAAAIHSPLGERFEEAVSSWRLEHSSDDVETILAAAKVPCSVVNTPLDCLAHPHFLARDDFVSIEDQTLHEPMTGFGIVPKMSETPGQVWRGAPRLGQDTDRILNELLGYSEERIRQLRDRGII